MATRLSGIPPAGRISTWLGREYDERSRTARMTSAGVTDLPLCALDEGDDRLGEQLVLRAQAGDLGHAPLELVLDVPLDVVGEDLVALGLMTSLARPAMWRPSASYVPRSPV